MESDPIIEELWRIREEIWEECGRDPRRFCENALRQQYLRGRDLYGRSKVTGQIEVVWRAPRAADGVQGAPTTVQSAPAADCIGPDAAAGAVTGVDTPPSRGRR
jgi:hypothetical protein